MKSIVQKNKECFVCKSGINLHEHHIFFGMANRKLSEKYGLKVWLCGRHHNLSNEGIHFNSELDRYVKRIGQQAFEKTHTRQEFMQIFGKSYLWERNKDEQGYINGAIDKRPGG